MDLMEALTRHFADAGSKPDSPDDFTDQIVAAFGRYYAGPGGHQATAAERAGAYERYARLRNEFCGQPRGGREQVRNSLSPEGASLLVRRIFGGGRG